MNEIKRYVSHALELDGIDDFKNAYQQYLLSVKLISETLLADYQTNGYCATNFNKKCIQLGIQCLDRLKEVQERSGTGDPVPSPDQTTPTLQPSTMPVHSSHTMPQINSFPTTPDYRAHQSTNQSYSFFQPTSESYSSLQPSNQLSTPPSSHSTHSPAGGAGISMFQNVQHNAPADVVLQQFTQIEKPSSSMVNHTLSQANQSDLLMSKAQERNKLLMSAYHARIARLRPDKTSANSMSLRLQRQMIENMEIAKTRKKTLEKKMKERQQRMEQETAKRFGSMDGMPNEEKERMKLYMEIMLYEQNQKWKDWRAKLDAAPDDVDLMSDLVTDVLRTSDHPLTLLLKSYQYGIYDCLKPIVDQQIHKLQDIRMPYVSETQQDKHVCSSDDASDKTDTTDSGDNSTDTCSTAELSDGDIKLQRLAIQEDEAVSRHLTTITHDVQNKLDNLLAMFGLAYEALSSEVGRDACYVCVEEMFFEPIWLYLLSLFRLCNVKEERNMSCMLTKYQNVSPEELRIKSRYYPSDESLTDGEAFPYHKAITELQSLVHLVCPLKKLECIVRVCQATFECMLKYSDVPEAGSKRLGADDLLPSLSLVVMRSQLPQLVSECDVLKTFIPDGYLQGQEGYCLTSLMIVLEYIAKFEEVFSPSSSTVD